MASVVCSWNVWGIPFASWRVFGRQQEWRAWCDEQLSQQTEVCESESESESEGLAVLCFQEAWAWRCGPAWPFCRCVQWLQSVTGRNLAPLGCIAQLLCVFLGWLVPCILWDTKAGLTDTGTDTDTGTEFRHNPASI